MNQSNYLFFSTPHNKPETPKRYYNLKITKLNPDKLNIMNIPRMAKLPMTIDLRKKMPPIYDQGDLGSCTANALCALISFLDPNIIGSRLFLYYNERAMIGTTNIDSGAYIHDGVNSLVISGICPENNWPYNISQFAVKPSPICYTKALDHQALVVKNIKNDLLSIKNALNSGYPIVLGILVYASFETPTVAKTGVVQMPKKNDILLGGHAVCCVGYKENTKQFIMRNSWGTSWGEKGYFYLPYNYLTSNKLTSDLWCITKVEKI